jgi:hypothetical protein
MESHDALERVCVGYNNFQFPGFYKVLAEMQHTEWVESQRIHMGTTEFDRKLDRVAALNMETAGNLNKMHGNVASLLQSSSALLQSSGNLGKTAEVAMHTEAWASNQRDAFELVITTVLKDNFLIEGYTLVDILASKHCKLPYHISKDGSPVDATQWDGVVMMEDVQGRGVTFLVEAKKTKNTKHMLDMPDRIERVKSFIDVCDTMLKDPGLSKAKKALCYIWSLYKDNEVCGVLGADALPDSALKMVKDHGMISIQLSSLGWSVDDERK